MADYRIGDHPPPRAPFQILIALCATPRFLLLLVQWLVHRYPPMPVRENPKYKEENTGGTSSAVSSSTMRTRVSTKLEDIAEEILSPVEDAIKDEQALVKRNVDLELFVGIARTFSW